MDEYCKRAIDALDKERHYTLINKHVVLIDKDMQNVCRMTKIEAEEMMLRQLGAICIRVGNDKRLLSDLEHMSLYEIHNRDKIIQTMEEDYFMTFVGIAKSKNGMVAFGDSKVTSFDSQRLCLTDIGETQKVFRSKHLLIVVYHNADDSQIPGDRPLSDIINKVLKHHPNIKAEQFRKKMERALKSDKTFYFILGFFDTESGEYTIRNLVIRNGYGVFRKNNTNVVTNNDAEQCQKFVSFSDEMTLTELKQNAKELVQKTYDSWMTAEYNPIGGHIRIMTLPRVKGEFDETCDFE